MSEWNDKLEVDHFIKELIENALDVSNVLGTSTVIRKPDMLDITIEGGTDNKSVRIIVMDTGFKQEEDLDIPEDIEMPPLVKIELDSP